MTDHNDKTRYRLGDELLLAAPELLALGDHVASSLDEFKDVQERFTDKAMEYESQVHLVRLSAITRIALRAVLVEAEQAAWEKLPSVGTTARRKPRQQVEQERMLLFPYGRPKRSEPGDHALLLGTDALVSALTGDSDLARAWPEENLRAISEARDAFAPAYEAWKQATYRRSVLLTELEPLREEWTLSLGRLRDEVKRAFRRQKLPNRFASLFRHRKPSRAVKEEKPEQDPPPPPNP